MAKQLVEILMDLKQWGRIHNINFKSLTLGTDKFGDQYNAVNSAISEISILTSWIAPGSVIQADGFKVVGMDVKFTAPPAPPPWHLDIMLVNTFNYLSEKQPTKELAEKRREDIIKNGYTTSDGTVRYSPHAIRSVVMFQEGSMKCE